ncbi:DUF6596 domain-containing protein [Mumia sp.]|uniref:RNA polymerase sigma factor n=1 Tax=Mumia sp. TaxID=1965300 RepID=UPI00261A126D|nr:DUF6596 domain-containing protein [Mumia sp.]MDD9347241.1 sigma factor [Mumia sp.]
MDRLLRDLMPQVLGVLLRRGADFASGEDAVQEAMIEAVRRWPGEWPDDPRGWLVTVAWRKYLDTARAASARRAREERVVGHRPPGPTEQTDDTLRLLFLCCHPALGRPAQVALTLRAVGGLSTAQIARAFLLPEATMAQRISRAKRTVAKEGVGPRGDLRAVLKVLYLIFNEGYTGAVDLAAEAIRLTRMLARATDDPEVAGLLALMLLHHARRDARWAVDGSIVPLAEQDRSRWDTRRIAEGVDILQTALARQQVGEYQAQAAIAALHCDAAAADETDWPQILQWYDELLEHTTSPVVAMNRAVAVGEVQGPAEGLRALDPVPAEVPRRAAVAAWLHERAGDRTAAARLYAEAAAASTNVPERDHLTRQAARLRHEPPSGS